MCEIVYQQNTLCNWLPVTQIWNNVIMKCSQAVQVMYGRHTAVGSTLKEQNELTVTF